MYNYNKEDKDQCRKIMERGIWWLGIGEYIVKQESIMPCLGETTRATYSLM